MSYTVKFLNEISKVAKDDLTPHGFKEVKEGPADIFIVRSKKLHENTDIDKAMCLARAGIGTGNVPCDRLRDLGIPVFFAPGGNADSVVETTLGKIISGAKNMVQAVEFVKESTKSQKELESVKKQFKGTELKGKSIVIIGLGMIGARLAYFCSEMGMKVYGKDLKIDIDFIRFILGRHDIGKNLLKLYDEGKGKVQISSELKPLENGQILISDNWDGMIKEADFITIHCGYWGKPVFDAEFFKKCKKGITVINNDRGELTVEKDMLKALNDGTVLSYQNDFASELPELRKHKNCISTPHIAASTPDAEASCAKMVVNSILSYIYDGNLINPKNMPYTVVKRDGPFRVTITNKDPIKNDEVEKILAKYTINQKVFKDYRKTVYYSIFDLKDEVADPNKLQKELSKFGKVVRVIGKEKKWEEIKKKSGGKVIYNFFAGPSVMPNSVIDGVIGDLKEWGNTGISMASYSHRTPIATKMAKDAENMIMDLLKVPKDKYKVLFLQGGATTQFAQIPMNFSKTRDKIGYFETGTWTQKALSDAKLVEKMGFGTPVCLFSDKKNHYMRLPTVEEIKKSDAFKKNKLKYIYLCQNETIHGLEWQEIPDFGDIPLVIDGSSNFCSRPIDWSKNIGLLYAGAQKNCGFAGVTILILRLDMLDKAHQDTLPAYIKYQNHVTKDSMWNTPPVVAIDSIYYMMKWLKNKMGGIPGMEKVNKEKSDTLYEYLDSTNGYYLPRVEKRSRSRMNVRFNMKGGKNLEAKFEKESAAAGLLGLGGHRSIGGGRASLYNAMTLDGVKALIEFMTKFRKNNPV